ncbi:MAG: PAS domain S-box protein, partial [Ferruginibacter sp.]
DENGYIEFTNYVQNEMFGFKEGELLGKHISILGSNNIDENSLENISLIIEEKGFWNGRFLNMSKSGNEFITQSQISSIDLNGKKMLISVQRNITEELKRNAELSRFKYMVDNFNDPVILIKEDGKFAYLNNIALKQWGYNEEQAKELTIFDVFPGYSRKKYDTAFVLAQKSALSNFELNLVTSNGSTCPVELSMSALLLENVTYLFAAIRDISERKKAEMRLALSLKQFKEMAETMPQFVWTADINGNLNYFNKSVYEYSGMGEKDLLGDGYLKMVHAEDQEQNVISWTNSIKNGEPFMLEHRFRRKDGEYRWMLSRAVGQKNKNGQIELWVGTSTDIHDRKLRADLLEESVESRTVELKKVNARLKQSNSELEQFAYVASHDLQEPLRKIKTFASLMVEGAKNYSENENNYLQKIISSSERMTVLINDVLNFAKLTHDEKTYSEVDLNEIVSNVETDLELQIKYKNVSINSDVLPVISAVPIQMNQLFFNLMSNSLKFGKPDTPLQIEIKVRDLSTEEVKNIPGINEKNKFFEIIFKDNGMGFDQMYADKIFNIFQRLNNRSFSGSGIGLALCRRIVIFQGGTIYAVGKENEGAEFHIVLPYQIKLKQIKD